jgi:hypothetical protein
MPINRVSGAGPLAIARRWQSQALRMREGAQASYLDDHQRAVLLRAARAADHAAEHCIATAAFRGASRVIDRPSD